MSAAPWTPGPWEVTDADGTVAKHIGPKDEPDAVYLRWTPNQSADARLIAAAPEMADWLADFVHMNTEWDPVSAEELASARALLARIRGETP